MIPQDLLARILAALLTLISANATTQSALTTQNQQLQQIVDMVKQAQSQVTVAANADLQATMDSAPDGATLYLPAGATFTGHFTCNHPLTLSTQGTVITDGKRANPNESGTLAILSSPDTSPAYASAPGVGNCNLVGIEIHGSVNYGQGNETDLTQLSHDDLVKHVIIHATGLKRALNFHGSNMTLIDSYIDGARVLGQDSQAVWVNDGPGPYLIQNNYLEASSENLLFGGDRVRIPNLVPADITITGNTFQKPLAWHGVTGYNVKNLLEVKNAQRLTITNNIFDGNWVDAQVGYAIVFTPRDQYGDNTWAIVSNVDFENNIIRNTSSGVNLLGDDDEFPSQRTHDITIKNNHFSISRATFGGDGRCMQAGRGPQNVTWNQNTCISDGTSFIYTYAGGSTITAIGNASFQNNIFVKNSYGFMSTSGEGTPTLTTFYPGGIFTGNVIGGASSKLYPTGNQTPDMTTFKAQFSDYTNGILVPNSIFAGIGAN